METEKLRPLSINFVAQNPDEEIYLLLRKHFVTNASWLVTLFLLVAIPVFFLFLQTHFPFWSRIPAGIRLFAVLLWLVASFGYALLSFARWYFHVFLITSSRVMDIDLVGFLYRNVAETQLALIQDVSHTQGGILQILFNYGNVYVQTAATRQEIELTGVSHPGKIHDVITDLASHTR